MIPAETRPPDSVVLVGSKPPMNYVLAVVSQFHTGTSEVVLKARGRAISRAVDVAEIVRNKFVEKCTVSNVRIATEHLVGENGRKSNVSSIEIHLARQA